MNTSVTIPAVTVPAWALLTIIGVLLVIVALLSALTLWVLLKRFSQPLKIQMDLHPIAGALARSTGTLQEIVELFRIEVCEQSARRRRLNVTVTTPATITEHDRKVKYEVIRELLEGLEEFEESWKSIRGPEEALVAFKSSKAFRALQTVRLNASITQMIVRGDMPDPPSKFGPSLAPFIPRYDAALTDALRYATLAALYGGKW